MRVIRDGSRLREVNENVAKSVPFPFKCEMLANLDERYGYASAIYSADPPAGLAVAVTETGVSLFVVAGGMAIDSSDVAGLEEDAHVAWAADIVSAVARFGLVRLRSPKWFPIFSEWVVPKSEVELTQVLEANAGFVTRHWAPWSK